ncbi:hypothetical protein BDZ91DRAFT_738749 [Kalaharituber pfeilii]|nr:hypothetical protein BDZ91DRAFT_738749 [Kalaharituber pfeilii]
MQSKGVGPDLTHGLLHTSTATACFYLTYLHDQKWSNQFRGIDKEKKQEVPGKKYLRGKV